MWSGSMQEPTAVKPPMLKALQPKMWWSRWNVSGDSTGQDGLCEDNLGLTSSLCVTFCSPDGPSFEELSCPSNWTWVEGSGQLFSCEVDGKPEPSVECIGSGGTSDGMLLPLAPPDPRPSVPSISSKLAPGIYICNATNRHGSMVKTVAVSTECERGPGWREVGAPQGPGPSLTPPWLLCSAAANG